MGSVNDGDCADTIWPLFICVVGEDELHRDFLHGRWVGTVL